MGVVYEARDRDLDRQVAIKTLRTSLLQDQDERSRVEFRRRFLQEARAAAALSHPGATTIYRTGQLDDDPYIVMEWLEGRTLEDSLSESGPFPVRETIDLVLSLLETLGAAHKAGIVHRDIKPSNLLILDDGRLKVTDFGIALMQGRELVKTQAGVVFATPRFASPEQLRGTEIDGRADLFSTGVVLYLMLTGEYPFAGQTFMDLAHAILQNPPKPPREHRPDLPPALERAVLRVLSKDPDDRPETARELGRLLRDAVQEGTGAMDPTLALGSLEARPANGQVTESGAPVLKDLPPEPIALAREVVSTWAAEDMPVQATTTLLGRLFDRPLHTAAFSGAVEIEASTLLVADGRLVAAWTTDGGMDREAMDSLPASGGARLRRAPEAGWVMALATLTHEPRYRNRDLDSSFVDLPALADKLRADSVCGVIRLQQRTEGHDPPVRGWIFLGKGRTLAALYTRGWDHVPVNQSWRRWVEDHPVTASVQEPYAPALEEWYPLALGGLRLNVDWLEADAGQNGTGSTFRRFLQGTTSGTGPTAVPRVASASTTASEVEFEAAPAYRALTWLLSDLPNWFRERRRAGGWRYLAEWVPKIRRARLYHPLRRPGTGERDRFDLVTFDERGKVLHLVQRSAGVDPESLSRFVERVKVAKEARTKTGDIGAALLIAPRFDQATLEAYDSVLESASSGRWLSLGEALTGYEGFVRTGPRRGFHLLLVAEGKDYDFQPVIPAH